MSSSWGLTEMVLEGHDIIDRHICNPVFCIYLLLIRQYIGFLYIVLVIRQEFIQCVMYSVIFSRFHFKLWNVLDGRCLSLAKTSNGADHVAVDAICELQYMLGFLDEMQMEEICDDGFGILNLNELLLQHKPRID